MFTVEFERIGYAPFILRAVSSATRPLLVEEVYAAWAASVTSSASHLVRWPAPGRAWETFESDVQALVTSGDLVICADDAPETHPHHHLTRGHEGHTPFRHGPAPTVRRYLSTPTGSAAWRDTLSDRPLRRAVHALTTRVTAVRTPRPTPVGAGRR
ncbi:hypothetical protein Ade02nite_31980 [Paractinoplanes deccanensis]|uniref:Uncharacterized protein n=1 Tax=Paractinoplanes deccanensis TaxID=113561 RepID=A0ABQ3Y3L2_9ACTN|nr:hypothetical protein [Actinoplanes deccanensis]GID74557.1 hypothetical protein Ade02nite_31980 [Actinoplanes deccanensis]